MRRSCWPTTTVCTPTGGRRSDAPPDLHPDQTPQPPQQAVTSGSPLGPFSRPRSPAAAARCARPARLAPAALWARPRGTAPVSLGPLWAHPRGTAPVSSRPSGPAPADPRPSAWVCQPRPRGLPAGPSAPENGPEGSIPSAHFAQGFFQGASDVEASRNALWTCLKVNSPRQE